MTENLKSALDHLSKTIKEYRNTDTSDVETMLKQLQQITGIIAYLSNEKASYHNKFQVKINQLILQGNPVSRAENEAHTEYPEIYLLRNIINSANQVVDAIRSIVSYYKTEKFNQQNQ